MFCLSFHGDPFYANISFLCQRSTILRTCAGCVFMRTHFGIRAVTLPVPCGDVFFPFRCLSARPSYFVQRTPHYKRGHHSDAKIPLHSLRHCELGIQCHYRGRVLAHMLSVLQVGGAWARCNPAASGAQAGWAFAPSLTKTKPTHRPRQEAAAST